MLNPGEYNFYSNNEEKVEVVPNEVTHESDESNEESEVLVNLTRDKEHEENNETSNRYSLRSWSTVPEL